jgi:hypothetical protein
MGLEKDFANKYAQANLDRNQYIRKYAAYERELFEREMHASYLFGIANSNSSTIGNAIIGFAKIK